MMGGGGKLNSVFYADTYHPIQAGSIDGTDTLPHDNAVYRALVCYNAGLYDPSGDPKAIGGDPYCTVFVGRLNHLTTEDTLLEAMSKYGRVKSLRLVRDIVTGASRGYAFVEYETEREMGRAYKDAHHSFVDDSEIIVDYNRQQLMPGWIPRRLGGGLGGRKESGQLRFGGRDRPFRAPLQAVPVEDLKRLGIPPPPEGRYLTRFQVPSPPRRKQRSMGREESSHKRSYINKGELSQSRSVLVEGYHNKVDSPHNGQRFGKRLSVEIEDSHKGSSSERSGRTHKRISLERRGDRDHKSSSVDGEKLHDKRSATYNQESSHRRYKYSEGNLHERSLRDVEAVSHKRHRHGSKSDKHKRRRSVSGDWYSERR